jgi:hypothetical protein
MESLQLGDYTVSTGTIMGLWASLKAAERRNEAEQQLNGAERRQAWRQSIKNETRANDDARSPYVIPREYLRRAATMREAIQESRHHNSPSKRVHDRERSLNRDKVFAARRRERLELWGYVRTRNGTTLTIQEASSQLTNGSLRAQDIAEWVNPTAFHDVIESIGEVDAVKDYPSLGIVKGTVLRDPKLRTTQGGHIDPALRRI